MIAPSATAKYEVTVISLVDQGADRLCTTDAIDGDARNGRVDFEQIEPLEPTPRIIRGIFRTDEILFFVKGLAYQFRRCQCKFSDRIALKLQAAEIRPSPW